MADSNVFISIGIDAGSKTSKAAYSDSNGTRIIARLEGFDVNVLREESEIKLDDIITSCVIALPDDYNKRQHEDILNTAKRSGFENIDLISEYEAMNWAIDLESETCALICDFGASRVNLAVIGSDELIDSEVISDFGGNECDKYFASWLSERFILNLIDEKLLRQRAEQIKFTLGVSDSLTWRGIDILREDFERLIYFPVKSITHHARKFMRIYKPDKFILSGGMSSVPLIRRLFTEALNVSPEINADLIAKGAALKAKEYYESESENNRHNHDENLQRLRELKSEIIELEANLTRSQKDKLYLLFRQAEGINDSKIIALMEGLINELKDA
ncbi:MAG: Hsp70 family protein [Synergistaceae bacterium]|nr:Hsp70 family protein [Synergistaceae bacterium]